MMQGRNIFLEELLSRIDSMISAIEGREVIDPDLSIARELAEQLREEVESLQD
jgi:hypothetical protein